MEKTGVSALARVLRVVVLIAFVCNLLVLPLVPGLAALVADGGPQMVARALGAALEVPGYEGMGLISPEMFFLASLWAVWAGAAGGEALPALLTLFYWLCGGCTAVILWQAKRVLDTILRGSPFQMVNARALKRAAVCCWVIAGAALVRLVLWLWRAGNLAPLFTYTALFVPGFFTAGLLFLVMSALFRQAAELQEDRDLTI